MNKSPRLDLKELFLKQEYFLSDLLPYDPCIKTGNRFKDGLKEYLLLLTLVERMVDCIRAEEWKNFDPLVGENACQIRAVKLAFIISSESLDVGNLAERIAPAKKIIENAISRLSTLNSKNNSLQTFLDQDLVNVKLSPDECFLLISYILTRTKVSNPFDPEMPLVKNERTDVKKIKQMGEVGYQFAADLVSFLREKLSKISVDYVRSLSRLDPESSIVQILDKYEIDHQGLKCLPCFWGMKILLEQSLQKGIPIIFQMKQRAKDCQYKEVQSVNLYFQATPEGYQKTTPDFFNPRSPALIFQGTSCENLCLLPDKEIWIEKLSQFNPIDLLLAYAASHRQYPDESKDCLLVGLDDPSYLYYRTKANEWGCSLENPSTFFACHVYCDKIENVNL